MNGTDSARAALKELKENSGWGIAFGIILVVLGIVAIVMPVVPGLAIAIGVGVLFLILSCMEILHGLRAGSWKIGIPHFVGGLLSFFCGILMILHPVAGLGFLTLLLAIYFFATGITTAVQAWQLRPLEGWAWALFTGCLSVLLGILILVQWPLSGAWAVGTLAGIRMLFAGWSFIALSMAARDA